MTKNEAMKSALATMAAAMATLSGNYGVMNSMSSEFKNLKQQVDSALAMPDDPATVAPVVLDAGASNDAVAALTARLDGFEETFGVLMASVPSSEVMAGITARLDQIGMAVTALSPA